MRKKFNILPLIQDGKRIVPFKFILHYRYFNPLEDSSKKARIYVYGSTEHGPVKSICKGKVLERCKSCELPEHDTKWFTTELFVVTDQVLTGIWIEITNFEEIQLKYVGFVAKESSIGIGETVDYGECYDLVEQEESTPDARVYPLMINVLYSYNRVYDRAEARKINTLYVDYITGNVSTARNINVLYSKNMTTRANPLMINTLYSYERKYDRALASRINTLYSHVNNSRANAYRINTLYGSRTYERANVSRINLLYSYEEYVRPEIGNINVLYSFTESISNVYPSCINVLYSTNLVGEISRATPSRINTLSAMLMPRRATPSNINTIYKDSSGISRAASARLNTLYSSFVPRWAVMTGCTGVTLTYISEKKVNVKSTETTGIKALIYKCFNNWAAGTEFTEVNVVIGNNSTKSETILKTMFTNTTDVSVNGDRSNIQSVGVTVPGAGGVTLSNGYKLTTNHVQTDQLYFAIVFDATATGVFDLDIEFKTSYDI